MLGLKSESGLGLGLELESIQYIKLLIQIIKLLIQYTINGVAGSNLSEKDVRFFWWGQAVKR